MRFKKNGNGYLVTFNLGNFAGFVCRMVRVNARGKCEHAWGAWEMGKAVRFTSADAIFSTRRDAGAWLCAEYSRRVSEARALRLASEASAS